MVRKPFFFIVIVSCVMAILVVYAENKTISEGEYRVGEDIRAGEYTIKCVEASKLHSDYQELRDELSSLNSITAGLFDIYDSLVDSPTVMVKIINAAGDVLFNFKLKTGETKDINLTDSDLLKIDGKKSTCSLILRSNSNSIDQSSITWGMNKESLIKVMGYKPDMQSTDENVGLKMSYRDQPISKYTGVLTFYVRDDKLFSRNYSFDDPNWRIYYYLKAALNQKYGNCSNTFDDYYIFLEALSGRNPLFKQYSHLIKDEFDKDKELQENFECWNAEDSTIYLFKDYSGQREKGTTVLFYIQHIEDIPEEELNLDGL